MPAAARFACVIALSLAAAGAVAQPIALRKGESADLHAVYWVANCKSLLQKFAGVDMLEGPPGLRLSIREEPVTARRQNCPDKVPGGTLVVTAESVPEKASVTVRYRVNYDTQDGRKQSTHTAQVDLYP